MKKYAFVFLALGSFFTPFVLEAPYLFKNGHLINTQDMAEFSVEVHYNKGLAAVKNKKWEESVKQFNIVITNFPDAELAQEAYYFLGVSYYHVGDYDLANKNLSEYLTKAKNPKYFVECLQHKLAVGDAFAQGARKHLLGQDYLPRLFACREEALKIFDEIIAALPTHDIAMQALFKKACVLADDNQFATSITTLQSLIRKFPKTEKACTAYVTISEILLREASLEQQNPDLLPLASINISKLESDFPKATDEIAKAKKAFTTMQEVYAQALFDTGAFYERKKERKAALIYYNQVIRDFPETRVSVKCKERTEALKSYAKEFHPA